MKVIELKTAMDARFAEVTQQFAEVTQQFAEVTQQFAEVTQQFADVKTRFAKIDERFAKIDERFAKIDERFEKVDERFEALDRRITSEAAATRRHFDVVAEDLKSDIRLLAGAVAAISSTLERHINTSLSERRTVFGALDNHEVRLTALERHRA